MRNELLRLCLVYSNQIESNQIESNVILIMRNKTLCWGLEAAIERWNQAFNTHLAWPPPHTLRYIFSQSSHSVEVCSEPWCGHNDVFRAILERHRRPACCSELVRKWDCLFRMWTGNTQTFSSVCTRRRGWPRISLACRKWRLVNSPAARADSDLDLKSQCRNALANK